VSEIRYARSGDVYIAFSVAGAGPIDIVWVPGWVSHLRDDAQAIPALVGLLDRLSRFARLIKFDKRGTGMSDRVDIHELPTLEQRMDDVRAVMEAAGSERAAIFGISEGGPMAALFAATYPERTSALLMYGSYARRTQAPGYPWGPTREEHEAWMASIEANWGTDFDIEIGECEVIGTKLGGVAVHVGVRVAGAAGPSEVLVTRTVRDLVAGSGLRFEDRGMRRLKDLPEEIELFAAAAPA